MDLNEINTFIEQEIKRLDYDYKDKSDDESTMAMGFKVVEEIGELFNEFIAHKGFQRKEKLEKMNKEEIKKEFADVIFTVLIWAKKLNVDIEEAITIKMKEIKKRSLT